MIWTGPGVQVECQESHWTPTGFQLEFFGSEKNLTKLDFAGNIPGHFLVIPGGFLVIPGHYSEWIPDGFLVSSWWIPGHSWSVQVDSWWIPCQFLVDS